MRFLYKKALIMKRFNTLHASLVSLLITFSAYGMDAPINPFFDLFNTTNDYIVSSIATKNNKLSTMDPVSALQNIRQKIANNTNELVHAGLSIENMNEINNPKYENPINSLSDDILLNIKDVTLKAYLEHNNKELCSLLESTFSALNCKSKIYTDLKGSGKVINQIASYYKKDALFLIDQLQKKVGKKEAGLTGLLKHHAQSLQKINNFCSEINSSSLKPIAKGVKSICNKIIYPYGRLKESELPVLQSESFGQSSLGQSSSDDLNASAFFQPSQEDLLENFSNTANNLIESLTTLKNSLVPVAFSIAKTDVLFYIQSIITSMKDLGISTESRRLLNLMQMYRTINRAESSESLDIDSLITKIKSIKTVTINRIKNSENLEASSLQMMQEESNIKIQNAQKARKPVKDQLLRENELIKNEKLKIAQSKTITPEYALLLTQHIKTLQTYLMLLTEDERDLTKKIKRDIIQNQNILDSITRKTKKLLPYPFSDKESPIVAAFDMINKATIMNEFEGRQLLKEAIDTFRNTINPYTLFNRERSAEDIVNEYFTKPNDLKIEMLRVYNKNISSTSVCDSIPFFLNKLHEYQLYQDSTSKKLIAATTIDLLTFIAEQTTTNQLLNSSTELRQDILSKELNAETMQAYLLLLNSSCRFYPTLAPEIKTQQTKVVQRKTKPQFNKVVNDLIHDVAANYQQEKRSTDSNTLFKTTIEKLNSIPSISPLLLGTLKTLNDLQDNELQNYLEKIQLLPQNQQTIKIINAINEAIKTKSVESQQQEVPALPETQDPQIPQELEESEIIPISEIPQENTADEPNIDPTSSEEFSMVNWGDFKETLPITTQPSADLAEQQEATIENPQEEFVAEVEAQPSIQQPAVELVPTVPKIEIPQIIAPEQPKTTEIPQIALDESPPIIKDLSKVSNQELIKGIEVSANPILTNEATLNKQTLNSIFAYVDQLIKNETVIRRNKISPYHFTHLAHTISLLTGMAEKSKAFQQPINDKINELKARIKTDTQALINQINSVESNLAVEAQKYAIETQYFSSYAKVPTDILHEAKDLAFNAIDFKALNKNFSEEPKAPIILKQISDPAELASRPTPTQPVATPKPIEPSPVVTAQTSTIATPAPVVQTPATPAPAAKPTIQTPAAAVPVPQAPTPPESQPNWFSRTASLLWNTAKSWLNNVWAYLTYVS